MLYVMCKCNFASINHYKRYLVLVIEDWHCHAKVWAGCSNALSSTLPYWRQHFTMWCLFKLGIGIKFCLFICQMHSLWQNERFTINTMWKDGSSSFWFSATNDGWWEYVPFHQKIWPIVTHPSPKMSFLTDFHSFPNYWLLVTNLLYHTVLYNFLMMQFIISTSVFLQDVKPVLWCHVLLFGLDCKKYWSVESSVM